MPGKVLEYVAPERGGTYVDATVGLGGHAERILSAGEDSRLIGIDRDAESLELASRRLERFGDRVTLVHDDFRNLPAILDAQATGPVAGILADLGISSYQLAAEGRGFSFQRDEPLDMRMDRSSGVTAAELLSAVDEAELTRILRDFSEERFARRVARAILRAGSREPIRTTGRLARVIESVIQRRGSRIHPATRTFQALRIAVNKELEGIETFVLDSVEALQARGRLTLLTFHSLEDRLIKTSLLRLTHRCSCPRSFPRCACSTPDLVIPLTRKPLRPTEEEIASNPRSRSAKLRAAERL